MQERGASGLGLDVEGDAALVEIPRLEVLAVGLTEQKRTGVARRVAADRGILDLDDLRAQIGEDHRPVGTRPELLQRQNARPGQRLGCAHVTGFCLIHWRAMMIRWISLVPSPMQVSGASR